MITQSVTFSRHAMRTSGDLMKKPNMGDGIHHVKAQVMKSQHRREVVTGTSSCCCAAVDDVTIEGSEEAGDVDILIGVR